MRTFALTVVVALATALPFSGAAVARDVATAELLRRDFSAAAELLEDAAERGDSEAQYRLAGLVRRGFVSGRQESESAELYRGAAAEGFTLAALAEPKTARFDWPQFASDQQLIALIWAAGRGDLDELDDLIGLWVTERNAEECFGDFMIRKGIVAEVKVSKTDFHAHPDQIAAE